jgi:hypothetical protein
MSPARTTETAPTAIVFLIIFPATGIGIFLQAVVFKMKNINI